MKRNHFVKLILILGLAVVSLGGLLLRHSAHAHASEETVSDNRTLQIYSRLLKDASEEEVDEYFQYNDDETLIIADESGGYLSSLTNDVNSYSELHDGDGKLIERVSFGDKKVAATIGEVKEYLKEQREK